LPPRARLAAHPDANNGAGATWAVLILPYLDQDNLYNQWNLSGRYYDQNDAARRASVRIYFCPTRRSAGSAPDSSTSGDQSILADGSLASNVPGGLGDYAVNLGTLSCMVGVAPASVRPIEVGIDPTTLGHLACRNDGQVIGDF